MGSHRALYGIVMGNREISCDIMGRHGSPWSPCGPVEVHGDIADCRSEWETKKPTSITEGYHWEVAWEYPGRFHGTFSWRVHGLPIKKFTGFLASMGPDFMGSPWMSVGIPETLQEVSMGVPWSPMDPHVKNKQHAICHSLTGGVCECSRPLHLAQG